MRTLYSRENFQTNVRVTTSFQGGFKKSFIRHFNEYII